MKFEEQFPSLKGKEFRVTLCSNERIDGYRVEDVQKHCYDKAKFERTVFLLKGAVKDLELAAEELQQVIR